MKKNPRSLMRKFSSWLIIRGVLASPINGKVGIKVGWIVIVTMVGETKTERMILFGPS